jgi:Anthranilate/para-aminobenzoate synthases component I
MIKPNLEEAKRLGNGCTLLPIALEIFSDLRTPIEILKKLREQSEDWYILESVNGGDGWGRYTFLGYKPVLSIYGTKDEITIENGSSTTTSNGNVVETLRNMIAEYKSPRISYLPPFTGGFVGYFAYDFVQNFIAGLRLNAKNTEGFQDFHLMMMDKVIAFDQLKQKIYLIVNIKVEDIEHNYREGVKELEKMEKMIFDEGTPGGKTSSICEEFSPVFTEDMFAKMVEKVKHHITEGEVFQAVVANRFQAKFKGDLLNTYRILRTTNPSPYMVYMKLGDMEIACSSPETLVSLKNGEVSSFPLAGTCPRGATKEEDEALIRNLLKDEKELAEHDMLVDLARNDVGKICRFGSVNVREYRQIKTFSHVSHIGSHVSGKLREGMEAIDVIAAAFPAGTLSGAPKKRACEIIDEAEGVTRGPYGGAIGYIDFAGNMDMCIGIRMAVLKGGDVFVQAGAGIVADSISENEYQETRNKAKAIMDALKNNGGVR